MRYEVVIRNVNGCTHTTSTNTEYTALRVYKAIEKTLECDEMLDMWYIEERDTYHIKTPSEVQKRIEEWKEKAPWED